MTLKRSDIERGLRQLAARLDAAGVEVGIYVVGGAAMVLTVRPERQSTADIDVWLNTHGDEALRARVFAEVLAVARINDRFGDNWLNDNSRVFVPEPVGADPAEWIPMLQLGGVRVVVARPEVLPAMKLHAARGRRDLPDLASLAAACGLSRRSDFEELFERFYPYDELKPPAMRWLDANTT